MRTKEEPFKWQDHNLEKMITSVNNLLENLSIDRELLRVSIEGNILKLGQGTTYRGNTQRFGDIVHTMLIMLTIFREKTISYLDELKRIVNNEVIETIDFELAALRKEI